MQVMRPVLALALALPLVISGYRLKGVFYGLISGTALSLLIVLIICRGNYGWRLSRDAAGYILRKGARYTPVVVGFLVIAQFDVFLVSRYLPQSQVGIFRVALRVAALFTYFSSAFLLALGPLRRTPVFVSAARRGGEARIAGLMVLVYMIATIFLLIGAAAAADLLARVAPSSYQAAAGLIPAIASGLLVHGIFAVTYRTSSFDNRLPRYGLLAIIAAISFVGVSLKMIPWFGLYGAAFAPCVAYIPPMALLLWYSQRGPRPTLFRTSAMVRTVLIGGALIAGVEFGTHLPLPARIAVDVVAILAYVPLLIVLRVLTLPQVKLLAHSLAGAIPRRQRERRTRLAQELQALPRADSAALELFVRHRQTLEQVIARVRSTEQAVSQRVILALSTVGHFDGGGSDEVGLMEYLFGADSVAERDAIGRRLWAEGVDPEVADLCDEQVRQLRELAPSAWQPSGPRSGKRQRWRLIRARAQRARPDRSRKKAKRVVDAQASFGDPVVRVHHAENRVDTAG
jgi:hypothetical protein